MTLKIPEFALVLLVGVSSRSKTDFASNHFSRREILTIQSDLSDADLDSQFHDVSQWLEQQLSSVQTAVIDAPFFYQQHRLKMLELARDYGTLPCAILFDIPKSEITDQVPENPTLSIRNHLELIQKAFVDIQSEGFTKIYHLKGTDEIQTANVQIANELYTSWAWEVSKRYEDYGRPPSKPFHQDDTEYILRDLEYAAGLIEKGEANDNIIRTALPYLLPHRFDDDPAIMKYVLESSSNWLPDEQAFLKAYWFTLWIEILRTGSAFDKWEWGLPAIQFIRLTSNPQPFLAIWRRHLRNHEKSALIHLVNTLLINEFNLPPVFTSWLREPFIEQVLETGYRRYEETGFATRIAMAENNLKRIIAKS